VVTVVCGVEERSPRSHACTYSFRRNALCLYGTFSVCAFSIVCARLSVHVCACCSNAGRAPVHGCVTKWTTDAGDVIIFLVFLLFLSDVSCVRLCACAFFCDPAYLTVLLYAYRKTLPARTHCCLVKESTHAHRQCHSWPTFSIG